jgi:mannose/cellobiose epimerase-like protein (N-acyl-D-glucosamine 2-epimerase family)
VPQDRPAHIYTYSDTFFTKGLITAAVTYAPEELPGYLADLDDIVKAIEENRFLMNEKVALNDAALALQEDEMGQRMILLGATGMLKRLGKIEHANKFANRFIQRIMDRHIDAKTGALLSVPGKDIYSPGHSIEFVGLTLEYLPADADPAFISKLEHILRRNFEIGFVRPGLAMLMSNETQKPVSPNCPWWALPETIRASALMYARTRSSAVLDVWCKAHDAFFTHYWRGNDLGIAYQTMTANGPFDFVPATPDLDPGYHTGLSLLGAIDAIDSMSQ